MTKNGFEYPGNNHHQFSKLLGLLAENAGNRVVVRPEQWEHSKCYGVTRLSKLQHYLELLLYKPDGNIAFSYRDFVFGIQDQRFSNLRQECARDICDRAKEVAARIQALFPSVKVEVEIGSDELQAKELGIFDCQICGKQDQDARTLSLRYNYKLSEISDKFQTEPDGTYSIRTCKSCRGSFLDVLKQWTEGGFVEAVRNIPVRVQGRTVMMNDEEWKAHTAERGEPRREPMRLA